MNPLATLLGKLRGQDLAAGGQLDWFQFIEYAEAASPLLQCTRHPLGFLHVELTPIAPLYPGERLRLHYWPHMGANPDEIGSLHDHVWKLASAVAVGGLRDRTFKAVPDQRGHYRGSAVEYGERANRFVDRGRFSLTFERELKVGPGDIYRIPARTLHDSEVVDAPAVTFVLATDDELAATNGPLILHTEAAQTGTTVRQPFDASEALSLVRRRLEAAASR
jgi:hypothetical protein